MRKQYYRQTLIGRYITGLDTPEKCQKVIDILTKKYSNVIPDPNFYTEGNEPTVESDIKGNYNTLHLLNIGLHEGETIERCQFIFQRRNNEIILGLNENEIIYEEFVAKHSGLIKDMVI